MQLRWTQTLNDGLNALTSYLDLKIVDHAIFIPQRTVQSQCINTTIFAHPGGRSTAVVHGELDIAVNDKVDVRAPHLVCNLSSRNSISFELLVNSNIVKKSVLENKGENPCMHYLKSVWKYCSVLRHMSACVLQANAPIRGRQLHYIGGQGRRLRWLEKQLGR